MNGCAHDDPVANGFVHDDDDNDDGDGDGGGGRGDAARRVCRLPGEFLGDADQRHARCCRRPPTLSPLTSE